MTKVKIVNLSKFESPSYSTPGAAGMDLRASIEAPLIIQPSERALVPTGIHIQLPQGYEAQIRPRSGLAVKRGVTVLNTPGTIDEDYTGQIQVILINHSTDDFTILPGDRIAQMVISKYEKIEWDTVKTVEDFQETERADGGFGSSGVK